MRSSVRIGGARVEGGECGAWGLGIEKMQGAKFRIDFRKINAQ